MRKSKHIAAIALVASFGLIAAACGSDAKTSNTAAPSTTTGGTMAASIQAVTNEAGATKVYKGAYTDMPRTHLDVLESKLRDPRMQFLHWAMKVPTRISWAFGSLGAHSVILVDGDVAHGDEVVPVLVDRGVRRAATQNRPRSSHQLTQTKRFGDVVVRTRLEAPDLVRLL